jgi:hypothetical protein
MKIERVGCPACAPVPEGPVDGPGCEQCDGFGYVYKVPNGMDRAEVRRQIAELKGGESNGIDTR